MFALFSLAIAHARKPVVKAPSDANLDSCDLCKAICIGVQRLHEEGQSVEKIEEYVLAECDILPDYDVKICKSLVDAYVPAVVGWLDQGLTPAEICIRLGYCH